MKVSALDFVQGIWTSPCCSQMNVLTSKLLPVIDPFIKVEIGDGRGPVFGNWVLYLILKEEFPRC